MVGWGKKGDSINVQVCNKKEAKPYRMFCNEALNELFTKLRSSASDSSSSFKFEKYDLIGSAKFNLITKKYS